jgi:tRNA 2-thiouridine synthesizing protein C
MHQRKRHLLVLRHAPYGSSLARASVDLALAMGAFEQDFDILFIGDGVLQLLPQQHSAAIGLKSVGRALSSLPLVDVDCVYADADALAAHGLDPDALLLPVRPVRGDDLRRLLSDCDHLVAC